jgi:hypothetical protein
VGKKVPWGDSDEAVRAYVAFVGWYGRMVLKYGLPEAVGVGRLRRAFWTCRKLTKQDRPFEKLDLLERGLASLKQQGLAMPSFHGLISKKGQSLYGIERLLSYATRCDKAEERIEDRLMRRDGG